MLMLIEIGHTNEEEEWYFLTLSIALGARRWVGRIQPTSCCGVRETPSANGFCDWVFLDTTLSTPKTIILFCAHPIAKADILKMLLLNEKSGLENHRLPRQSKYCLT